MRKGEDEINADERLQIKVMNSFTVGPRLLSSSTESRKPNKLSTST